MDGKSRADPFGAFDDLALRAGAVRIARLGRIADRGVGAVDRLPFSRKVLLECAVRNLDGFLVNEQHVRALAQPVAEQSGEVPFMPARVLLQDFTGVPCVVDLAAMRSAVARKGGDARKINPLVPVD